MSLENLLSRLSKVKGRNGAYTACCPAHDDKSPSLAIREEDGKILLKCFGGCEVSAIVAAVGMDMTDLFPPIEPKYTPQPKVRLFASDLLRVLHIEAQIVRIAAYDQAKGKALSEQDRARLMLACDRIGEALEVANG
jgi:hypothetical protein